MRRSDRFAAIEWKLGRGEHATRVHAHREWSVGVVLSGATSVRVGTRRARLERGGFLAAPPGALHLCMPEPGSGFAYSTLYVAAERAIPALGGATIGTVDESRAEALFAIITGTADEAELRDALAELAAALDSGSRSRLEPVPAMRFDGSAPGDLPGGSNRYRQYRSCRKEFGAGSSALLQTRRIEAAKALLRGGASVVDTAMECGYYDQSHLDRQFRLYTGLTPRAYRARR